MKKFIIIILILTFYQQFAQNIPQEQIRVFAETWGKNNFKFFEENFYEREIKEIFQIEQEGKTYAWGINFSPNGFIILSDNKEMKPIIGFSTEGKINRNQLIRDNFIYNFISKKVNLTENMLASGKIPQVEIERNLSEWEGYLNKNYVEKNQFNEKEIFGPFLNSDWGQANVSGSIVFNYYSPNNWPVGCVATATAQILNFYKWPIRGLSSHGYTDGNTGYQYADFYNTLYDWTNTLDQYTNTLLTTNQKKAAGLLSYHTAVSLDMDFEAEGSTASTTEVPDILHNYFRFSGHYESSSSTGFWDELKDNMIDSRPGIISISGTGIGHASVVDGFSETNNYYHLNPGWYGDFSGWYDISDVWNMSGYNTVVGAVKGIVPNPMINFEIERTDCLSFILSWQRSRNERADFYELQQSTSFGGTYTTISSAIVDSFFNVSVNSLNSYYYRVRANRDGIWWDFSYPVKITLGDSLFVTFIVDMDSIELEEIDQVVIRGNIPPLSGSVNSEAMSDSDSDGIYELTVPFEFDYSEMELTYRFFIQKSNGLVAETQNRTYTLSMGAQQILDTVKFDNFTGIEENPNEIKNFKLYQNYPNPFNPSTFIEFEINKTDQVELAIYNTLGQKVATLINKEMSHGSYNYQLSIVNYQLPSGVYFYSIKVGNYSETKKMILIK